MILHEITGSENAPAYQDMAVANGSRQYDFLKSAVIAALAVQRPMISGTIIKALNFHAIACLHVSAGEYRPCPVSVGNYSPPQHYLVPALMSDFINFVNLQMAQADPVLLSAFVLWRLNHIHPFINGNGRTARAVCYFVMCVKLGGWIDSEKILPQLLDRDHDDYVAALKHADASLVTGNVDLEPLHRLIAKLMKEQIDGADGGGGKGPSTDN